MPGHKEGDVKPAKTIWVVVRADNPGAMLGAALNKPEARHWAWRLQIATDEPCRLLVVPYTRVLNA